MGKGAGEARREMGVVVRWQVQPNAPPPRRPQRVSFTAAASPAQGAIVSFSISDYFTLERGPQSHAAPSRGCYVVPAERSFSGVFRSIRRTVPSKELLLLVGAPIPIDRVEEASFPAFHAFPHRTGASGYR